MALKNRANNKTSKNQAYPDNTDGLITPKKVRDVTEDLLDSAALIKDEFLINNDWTFSGGELTDGAAVSWPVGGKITSLVRLTTVNANITLTLSGQAVGGIYYMILRKRVAAGGNLRLTLVSTGYRFFGTNGKDGADEITYVDLDGTFDTSIQLTFLVAGNSVYVHAENLKYDGYWRDRGIWDGTGNLYPDSLSNPIRRNDTFELGPGGGTFKGQHWDEGTTLRALDNVPGQTDSKWKLF